MTQKRAVFTEFQGKKERKKKKSDCWKWYN